MDDPVSQLRTSRSLSPRVVPAAPVSVGPASVLRTRSMVLRPMEPGDRDGFIELVRSSREDLDRWMPIHEPGESDAALFDRQLDLTREGERSGRAMRRLGVLHETGTPAGMFNLVHIERGLTSEADANWWVGSRFTGRGLATQGVRAIVRHALGDLPVGLGLGRVVAGITPEHTASERIAQLAGFKPEPGAQTHLRIGGQWRKHTIWTVSAGEIEGSR